MYKELEKYSCRSGRTITLYLWTEITPYYEFGHPLLLEIYSRMFKKANVFYIGDCKPFAKENWTILEINTLLYEYIYKNDMHFQKDCFSSFKTITDDNNAIFHINYKFNGEAVVVHQSGNIINVIVDRVTKTPFLQNGDIIIHEQDMLSLNFFTLLIDIMNFILCHMSHAT